MNIEKLKETLIVLWIISVSLYIGLDLLQKFN
jgi:hypothetical protein